MPNSFRISAEQIRRVAAVSRVGMKLGPVGRSFRGSGGRLPNFSRRDAMKPAEAASGQPHDGPENAVANTQGQAPALDSVGGGQYGFNANILQPEGHEHPINFLRRVT